MNDDYFTKLDEQLSALTSEGAHLDRWARWRALDRAARRAAAALGLVVLLAGLLVIEFPGSASGSEHRANTQAARTAHAAHSTQAIASNLASRPTPSLGRLA